MSRSYIDTSAINQIKFMYLILVWKLFYVKLIFDVFHHNNDNGLVKNRTRILSTVQIIYMMGKKLGHSDPVVIRISQ